MLEKKVNVFCQIWDHSTKERGLTVWFDGRVEDLVPIAGVERVWHRQGHEFFVWTDPRYDEHEIAKEIHRLYSEPIPDVFKDALEREGGDDEDT